MKLKILGTQSPYNTSGHNCPGFLITDKKTNIKVKNKNLLFLFIKVNNIKLIYKIY